MNIKYKKKLLPTLHTYNNDLSKRWRVEYFLHTHNGIKTKRIVRYIKSFDNVESRLNQAYEIIESLKDTPPVVLSFFESILEHEQIYWRKKTISAYSTVIKMFLNFLSNRSPTAVDEKTILDFHVWLFKKGLSQNTIAKYNNTLMTLYTRAVTLKLIPYNPISKIKNMKRSPVSLQYFSDKQIQDLKKEIQYHCPQLWLCTQLLFYCFIRPSEQRCLKIQDINFDQNYIEIPASISKNKKTQKVVIPNQFLKEIQVLKKYPNNYYILSKNKTAGLVQISEKWINTEHSKCLNKLLIRGRYAFYSWKHTGVVKCVQSKMNIRDIQNQLRHHSLDMVAEYLKNLGVLQSHDLKENYPSI